MLALKMRTKIFKLKHHLIQTFILLIPVFFLFYPGYKHRWNSEDAFISFRVVSNILHGHGPVYNIEERVEAYTHPLWIAILTLSAAITGSIEIPAVWMGLLFTCLGLLFSEMGAVKLLKKTENKIIVVPLGAIVIASLPPFWDFATSGLETGLAFFWLGFSFFITVNLMFKPKLLACTLLWLSLGPLIRPDLGLFFFKKRTENLSILRIIKFLLPAFLLPFSYQIFRMGYFASLLPNPAIAKEAFGNYFRQGIIYLLDFTDSYTLFIPLLALAIYSIKIYIESKKEKKDYIFTVPFSFFIGGLIHVIYIVLIGGDFMHARLLLPGAFSIFISISPIIFDNSDFKTWVLSSTLTWCIICALTLRGEEEGAFHGIVNERIHYITCANHGNPVKISDYKICGLYHLGMKKRVDALKNKNEKVILYHENIGIAGFLAGSEVRVFDRLGLADPIASRLVLERRGRPGHEKDLPEEWVWARIGIKRENPKVKCAMEALKCGALKEYLEAIQGKFEWKNFLRNIVIAVKSRNLRIPADPCQAKVKLCNDFQGNLR